jgi:UDP:flavonoid glycosyltransferase YjiC (YdhE family)
MSVGSMTITIVGYGTRGDVQPYLCLGWELARRGQDVKICAPENLRAFVERSGLAYKPLPIDVRALLSAPEAQEMLANGRFGAFMKWRGSKVAEYRAGVLEGLRVACEGADTIVGHPLIEEYLVALAERSGARLVPLYLYPLWPTRRHASILLTTKNLGPLNALSYKLLHRVMWKNARGGVAEQRQAFGMAPARARLIDRAKAEQWKTLISYSSHLLARPDDWPAHVVSCGAIDLPDGLKEKLGERGLAPNLEDWLSKGPPPVYIGFGSMPVLDASRTLAMTRRVLDALGTRAVIGAGWSGLAEASDERLRVVGETDHAALFARCEAAVHHGGAGTTHASLRAGLPTLICSVFADQPFWGHRVAKLGAGTTFPFQKLDESRLLEGLRHLRRDDVRRRAQHLGAALRRERGLEEVADALLVA